AREGASFERFFVCPVCSPTRAEFLTGRYHPRGGVTGVTQGGERLNLGETTVADAFAAAGYATALFGKWHNGTQYPYHPLGRGFQEFYGFTSGHWGEYFDPMLEHNGKIVKGSGYLVDDLTDKTAAYIRKCVGDKRPFFAYLACNIPHSPMQVPDRFWSRFEGKELAMRGTIPEREDLDHTRAALAMCENLDWNVGRLLDTLRDLAIEKDTIVVYFCDNGPNGWRWNGNMKGIKGSTDEGGVRSPLLIRWKGTIPEGKTIPQIAGAIDLLPTLTELAGVPRIGDKELDGKSLKPLLLEVEPAWPKRMLFSFWNKRVSVRTQRYRMDDQGNLYDMTLDPEQKRDVAKQNAGTAAELNQHLQQWKQTLAAARPDDRPFPVGHPDFRYTQLPARDGIPHGHIVRSSIHPNCSFLTQWTSLDDFVSWEIEVLTTGEYQVEAFYTCPGKDVGSTVELSFNGQTLRGKITEANDPPLRGAQQDRVPRTESYVKDFRPLNLGRIRLDKGRGQLELRAIEIPGSQVMDLRLLNLTRV
ncbi:MAG: sulfatase-like hydrolase/transferase, partial [Phycisphaerae bacterium]|nr:sulfatase-like hydrolase/transferase [Phycisphaerae bacterium]